MFFYPLYFYQMPITFQWPVKSYCDIADIDFRQLAPKHFPWKVENPLGQQRIGLHETKTLEIYLEDAF